MIKTHKPRGHFWTCASVFQQSEEIRNINFEDCTPPPAETLGPDSDDELRPSQRAAKRRRIEKLAGDFLNGAPLVISSAKPHVASLKRALEWNERSRLSTKWTLPVLETANNDAELWTEVDDPWEAIPKPRSDQRPREKTKPAHVPHKPQRALANTETVTEVLEARSGCKPAKHLRVPKVSTEPSTEAVKQAAALRARKLQRAVTEAPRVPEDIELQATPDAADAQLQSEPASMARPRYFRTRKPKSTEWLLRRHTTLYELSPDESIDELSRSRIETPSRTQQHSADQETYSSPVSGLPDANSAPSSSGTVVCEMDVNNVGTRDMASIHHKEQDGILKSSADPLSLSFSQKLAAAAHPEASGSVARGSYHTAPEDTDAEKHPAASLSQNDLQADSQTRQLKRQGIRVAPRKSWASTNEPAPTALDESTPTTSKEVSSKSSGASTIRQSLQESAQHAGKPKKGKRAKSAGNAPQTAGPSTRRSSAPTESQNAEEQMASLPVDQQRRMSAFRVSAERQAYTEVQPAQEGGTPFMFRKKRTTKRDDGDSTTTGTTGEPKKGRRRVTFPTSEDAQTASKGQKKDQLQRPAALPPVLDMSLDHDSSFGMRLNMALVDEHLNAVLPNEPGSNRRSSAVKRALRQELRDSGAEISRIEGEPVSSQVFKGAIGAAAGYDPVRKSELDAEDGLRQARQLSMRGLNDAATATNASLEDEARQTLRDAIGEARRDSLSGLGQAVHEQQEPQTQWPGTQVALCQAQRDLFASPEKPVAVSNAAVGETPDPTTMVSIAPANSVREPLRELSQEQLPGTQAMMQGWSPWSNIKKPKSSAARPAIESPTGELPQTDVPLTWDPTTVASFEAIQMSDPTGFSTGPPIQSYYEAGQGHLLREDSDIDRTINELTADVLSTIDVCGIMSQ
ncbi:hypothetical protein LTR85_009825 [Meristemomyces frigidus]|nr:hypothetical protein LTR85_009825 [Meristemomyces frigidus]